MYLNFTPTQQEAFNNYRLGLNIFITGQGGCGKSYFIKQVYEDATRRNKNIKVTSLTGCSAILLDCNATTIHRWSGIGLAKGEMDTIYRNILKMKKTKNYHETDILVIDEVSMLNEKIFDLLNYLCKKIRKNNKPFGGIQVIFCGDFFQLPPVCMNKDNTKEKNFCFQSDYWKQTFDKYFIFNVNFRQNEDQKYFSILQEIREGNLSFDSVEELVKCSKKKLDKNDLIKPTILFPIKKYVDKVNQEKLENLNHKKYLYQPEIYYKDIPIHNMKQIENKTIANEIENNIKNNIFEEKLELCIGCQVMCIYNLDQENNLVNGSQGIIVDFKLIKNKHYPVVQFENITEPITIMEHTWYLDANKHYSIKQIPLVLSWAITIHKSQGLSIEKAMIDIGSSIFEYGQTYVALSRVKSLDGLYLIKLDTKKIKAHPEVVKFYRSIQS